MIDLEIETIQKQSRGDVADILANVMRISLGSINRLAKSFRSRETRIIASQIKKLNEQTKDLWRQSKIKKEYDLSIFSKAEANMRKKYLKLMFVSTVKYGNNVFTRRQDKLGETDTLNLLFNFAGAQMRYFAYLYYPLPVASDKNNIELGFEHNKYGLVYPLHPQNPSLDFIDFVRSHMLELCRRLFMYRVKLKYATRYMLILLHKFRPYLDWIYSGGKQGKNINNRREIFGFDQLSDMDKDLSEVINLVKIEQGVRYTPQRVTKKITVEKEKTELLEHIKDNFLLSYEEEFPRSHKYLKRNGEYNDEFFKRVISHYQREKKRWGTRKHNRMSTGLPQPFQLSDIILHGDRYIQNLSGYLVAAEVPVNLGLASGKADYIIFKKTAFGRRKIWQPIIIIDMKTKYQIRWDYKGIEVKNNKELMQPSPSIKMDRYMEDDLWNSKLNTLFDKKSKNQLREYSFLIHREFNRILMDILLIENKTHRPLEAILSVKGNTPDKKLKKEIHELLFALPFHIKNKIQSKSDPNDQINYLRGLMKQEACISTINGNSSLVFQKNLFFDYNSIFKLITKNIRVQRENEDPSVRNYNKEVILHLTVSSDNSLGKPEAIIAANYSCIKQAVEKHGHIWVLDLLNVFDKFMEIRLRIFDKDFLDRITFIKFDVNNPDLSVLQKAKDPVVITGWQDIKRMTRGSWDIETDIVSFLGSKMIYLIDFATADVHTSGIYGIKCVKPFNQYQERLSYVTNVVYNLPMPPGKHKKKMYNGIRYIYSPYENGWDGSVKVPSSYADKDLIKPLNTDYSGIIIDEEKILDLIKFHTPQKLSRIDTDRLKTEVLIKVEHVFDITHDPNIEPINKKRKINREFRSRNPNKNIILAIKNSNKIPDMNIYDGVGQSMNYIYGQPVLQFIYSLIEKKDEYDRGFLKKLEFISGVYLKHSNLKQRDEDIELFGENYGFSLLKSINASEKKFHSKFMYEVPFEEYRLKSYWLTLLILFIKLRYEDLLENQLASLWEQFSSWIPYTMDYNIKPGFSFIFNVADIWHKMNIIALKFDTTPPIIRNIRLGYYDESNNFFRLRLDGDIQGIFQSSPLTQMNMRVYAVSSYKKIKEAFQYCEAILIGSVLGQNYIWRFEDGWKLIGSISIRVNYLEGIKSIKISPSYLEIIPEIKPDLIKFEKSEIKPKTKIEQKEPIDCTVALSRNKNSIDMIFTGKKEKITRKGAMLIHKENRYTENYVDLNELMVDLDIILTQKEIIAGEYKWKIQYVSDIDWEDYSILYVYIDMKYEFMKVETRLLEMYNSDFPKDMDTFIDEFNCDSDSEIRILSLSVEHDQASCMNKSYDEIKSKQGTMGKYRHGDCFYVKCSDPDFQSFFARFRSPIRIEYLWKRKYITIEEEIEDEIHTTKYNLEFTFDPEMELIFREDPQILWIYRQVTKLFWKKTVTPLAHTQEDSFDIDEMKIADNTIKISLTSVLTGDKKVEYFSFFASDDCQKYREVNRILFYDGLNQDFTDKLNSKQLEEESQRLIDICQAHFNECEFCDYLRE